MADDAFSAAYLLASAAERIYLSQTAGVGSIGAIAVHVDESQRDAQEGRRHTTVFADARKNAFGTIALTAAISNRQDSRFGRTAGAPAG